MEQQFRNVFQIPFGHTLKETSFRSSAGSQRDRWTHEELDSAGNLIARYESWMNTTIRPLETTSGWRKLSPEGGLLFEANDLPI